MLSSKNTYIAFIDAMGISDMARQDDMGFYLALENFYQAVTKFAPLLNNNARVHHFSDCAYIEAPSASNLVKYLKAVRSELMLVNVFVRGAIGKGSLNPFGGKQTTFDSKGKVTGIYFGTDVVPIYRLESSLKGIGLRIDDTCAEQFSSYTVPSFFFPDYGHRGVVCFNDLRFAKEDLNDVLLRNFLERFLITNTRSQRIGRYYLSFLATWIQSHDFNTLRSTDLENTDVSNTDSKLPLAIRLLINGYFEKFFPGISSLECIYFGLLNKILDEVEDKSVRNFFLNFIFNNRRLIGRLGEIPNKILTEEHRAEFVNRYSNYIAKNQDFLTSPKTKNRK